jgi:hypothetical protein
MADSAAETAQEFAVRVVRQVCEHEVNDGGAALVEAALRANVESGPVYLWALIMTLVRISAILAEMVIDLSDDDEQAKELLDALKFLVALEEAENAVLRDDGPGHA